MDTVTGLKKADQDTKPARVSPAMISAANASFRFRRGLLGKIARGVAGVALSTAGVVVRNAVRGLSVTKPMGLLC
jgi:hypothetical protein